MRCEFCGEHNCDPEVSAYCLACRGTDWFKERQAYKEKLKTINFGKVPGGARG